MHRNSLLISILVTCRNPDPSNSLRTYHRTKKKQINLICMLKKKKICVEDGTHGFSDASLLQVNLGNPILETISPFLFTSLHLVVLVPRDYQLIQLLTINLLRLQVLPICPVLLPQLLVLRLHFLLWEPCPPLCIVKCIHNESPMP